jgi:cytochrome c peroxidase
MMRFILPIVVFCVLCFQQACKPDPPITPPPDNEPDSLFVGTPYTLKKPGLYFQKIDSTFTLESIRLGRMLFWDPILSADSSTSCATCHKPEFAFTDQKKFSTNLNGLTKRNTPSIQNSVYLKQVFWDGRQPTLEKATEDALKDEQHFVAANAIEKIKKRAEYVALFKKAFGRPGDITDQKIFKAISHFMRTAISARSKYDLVKAGQASFTPSEKFGFDSLFLTEKADCFHCHIGTFSTFAGTPANGIFLNNALDSAVSISDFKDIGLGKTTGLADDYGKFQVPSLRNLKYTAPFMHDGRYQTLEQVINFYSDSIRHSPTISPLMKKINDGGLHLTTQEKADLLAFLNTLNDDAFVTDTAFSNPFK